MGGVGARPAAGREAGASFPPSAHNPAPNKSAVAIIAMSPLRAPRIVEPPQLNFPHHRATEDAKAVEQSGRWRPIPLRRRAVLCTKKPLRKQIPLADCRRKAAVFCKTHVVST